MNLSIKTAIAGAMVLAGTSLALAQDVIIAPEQETIIREYVVREKVDPVPLVDFDLKVGSVLPETVEVRRLGVPDMEYEYVYTDRGTVLVEPGTRRVVRVLE